MQKVIVFELRLGLEHLGPLPESILVIYPTRGKYNEHPSWDPHAHSDLSRRPSGPWTPPRARLLRSIHHTISWPSWASLPSLSWLLAV